MSPRKDDPRPGGYRPFVAARRPGGKPKHAPAWRVVVHRKHLDLWSQLADRCGVQNAQQLWDHLANQPDRPPQLGTVTRMKGKHMSGTDGWSGIHHYEIIGAGRVDYRYHPRWKTSPDADEHKVVQIVSINLSSH